MKRFVVTLILTAVITGVLTYFMPKRFDSYLNAIAEEAQVSIYCRTTTSQAIDMGNGRIVQCSVEGYSNTIASCNDIDGVSVSFCGKAQDVKRIADYFNLRNVSVCELDGLTVICGRSYKVNGGVVLDGKLVNVQIAYKDGTVTVGSPLILGSY